MEELERYFIENESVLKAYTSQHKPPKLLKGTTKNKPLQNIQNIQISSFQKKRENENEIKVDTTAEVNKFLTINLEDWRRQRRTQLRLFVEELEADQMNDLRIEELNTSSQQSHLSNQFMSFLYHEDKSTTEQETDIFKTETNDSNEPFLFQSFQSQRKPSPFTNLLGEISPQLNTLNEICSKYQIPSSQPHKQLNKPHNHPSLPLALDVDVAHSPLFSTPIHKHSSKIEINQTSFQTPIGTNIQKEHENQSNIISPLASTSTASANTKELLSERKNSNSSTHFLVPGGLSTSRPILSPSTSKLRTFSEQNLK